MKRLPGPSPRAEVVWPAGVRTHRFLAAAALGADEATRARLLTARAALDPAVASAEVDDPARAAAADWLGLPPSAHLTVPHESGYLLL